MNNLQWLYDTNDMFRDAVKQAAAYYIGSTSLNFAGTWLEEQHRSDYEDLTGQHVDVDVDSREKLEADLSDYVHEAWAQGWEAGQHDDMGCCNFYVADMRALLDRQAEITRREWEYQLMKAGRDAVEIERSIAEKYRADAIAAQGERDAYRELCGRMRKMANDMLCMEVD